MKKIKVNTVVALSGQDVSTVGKQLHGLLEGMPTDDAKAAVKQVKLADELKEVNESNGEWFSFEESDQAIIQKVLDLGAKNFAARVVAPLQTALDEAVAFKGIEAKEKNEN